MGFLLRNVVVRGILTIDELVLPERMVTVISGESGSGKTTLLRLLNHLIPYDEGEVFYQERSVRDYPPEELRKKVLMIPQSPVIFPGTIAYNLQIGRAFWGLPEATEHELRDVLKKLHLEKSLGDNGEKLSGGEKQRVALGRALLLDPEVLLLDEPTSALDDGTEDFVMGTIVDSVKEAHQTLIMVTHSSKLGSAHGQNSVFLRHGRIEYAEE